MLIPERSHDEFDWVFVEFLLAQGAITPDERENLLTLRQAGVNLPLAAQQLPAVTPGKLSRAVCIAKGVFGLSWNDLFVEIDPAPPGGLESWTAGGFLPVSVFEHQVFGVAKPGFSGGPIESGDGVRTQPVVLQTISRFTEAVRRLEELRAQVHPRNAALSDYLVRRGALTAAQRSEIMRAIGEPITHDNLQNLNLWIDFATRRFLQDQAVMEWACAWTNSPHVWLSELLALADTSLCPVFERRSGQFDGFIPLRLTGDLLFTAFSRMPDIQSLDFVKQMAGARLAIPVITTPYNIRLLTEALYGPLAPECRAAISAGLPLPDALAERLGDDAISGPAMFRSILSAAVEQRASDIHIESFQHHVDLRFRVDGRMTRFNTSRLNPATVRPLMNAIKIQSDLDISERRRPQDGGMREKLMGREREIRVSIQPTAWGENAALRIQDPAAAMLQVGDLGIDPAGLAYLLRLLDSPHGLILVTGPTGSGKTTTLYSLLQHLLAREMKIMTAEDPIERYVDGIQQSMVNPAIGNSFDVFLRAFLRQDPDVILVGEIRDEPTTQTALRAAMTGHLVLSSLHVNNARGVVNRLEDMGGMRSLIADSLLFVISQRLVRRLCPGCKTQISPDPAMVKEFFPRGAPPEARFWRGAGCERCNFRGSRGRISLFELWAPAYDRRREQARQAKQLEAFDAIETSPNRSLVADALGKAMNGDISLEEAYEALSMDELKNWQREALSGLVTAQSVG
ncbi:MAG: hypothetical protein GMKNLPBB_01090 [Myxococcota bacterium]|nr:hypothetical protein [Myxococcota bacterium]